MFCFLDYLVNPGKFRHSEAAYLVTGFELSLRCVAGRAFRIQWWEYGDINHEGLEVAVSSPYIDWISVPSDRRLESTHVEDHPIAPRLKHPCDPVLLHMIGSHLYFLKCDPLTICNKSVPSGKRDIPPCVICCDLFTTIP